MQKIADKIFRIEKNQQIAKDIYLMQLSGDATTIKNPGQFVNLKIDGFYLRRPLSVCDCTADSMSLIYKTVGEGTKRLAELPVATELSLLLPLGNGFTLADDSQNPLLVGGGVGTPALYLLAKALNKKGQEFDVLLGFNSGEEVFYLDEFKRLAREVHITTIDGSVGTKGMVTDLLGDLDYDYIYCCGPLVMMRAVAEQSTCSGQYSFEARMACGFGACMGCTLKTKSSPKRICKDGPVFYKEELVW